MNLYHRWYCRSDRWRKRMNGTILPWAIGSAALGERVLEIGPGPGVVTDWLSTKVTAVTSVEIDPQLARALKARVDPKVVMVLEADATDMPLPDDHFDSAVCLTMLHHVPRAELQDRLLRETNRVIKPGGLFVGSDSTPSFQWRLYHVFDTCVPVDPATFAARLEAAGFVEVRVDTAGNAVRFRCRKPA